jgi:hypothetical protein
MPYVVCPACGIRTYSAARHSTADACPKCDTKLTMSPGVGARGRDKPSGEIVPNARRGWVRVAP